MNLSQKTLFAVLAATGFSVPFTADAAVISWGPAQTISTAANDVETVGTLVLGIDGGSSTSGIATTVTGKNGIAVSFQNVDTTLANALPNFSTKFGDGTGFGAGTSDYGALVDDGFFSGANAVDMNTPAFTVDTIVLSDLIIGAEYLVQYWSQDAARNPTFLTILDGSVSIVMDNSTDAGQDFGGFAVGTFTADATTQSIGVDGGLNGGQNYGRAQLNAFQLRLVPEPSSLALIVGGALAILGRKRSKME